MRTDQTTKSSLQCYSVLCTSFEKNEIEKFGILIFMSYLSETLKSYQRVKICPYSENNLDFMNIRK